MRVAERVRRRRARRRTAWREADYLVLDFETTALDLDRAAPLSVGWVPVRGGRLVMAGAGYTPLRYDGPLPPAAVPVHRLLPEDLRDAPPPAEVAGVLAGLLRRHVLVAHAVGFELALLGRLGVPARRREAVDTVALAHAVERLDGHRAPRPVALSAVAARYGLPVHRRHHAFGDALTTGGVLLALAADCERHGAGSLDDLLRLGGAGWLR